MELVEEHAPPTALIAVLSGGVGSNEFFLPDGPFGPAHVVAGNSGIRSAPLPRWNDSLATSLVDGFDNALQQVLFGDKVSTDELPQTYPDTPPLRGWWALDVLDREIWLSFRHQTPSSFRTIYRARYTQKAGWIASPSE
jgi:hypothetical protein